MSNHTPFGPRCAAANPALTYTYDQCRLCWIALGGDPKAPTVPASDPKSRPNPCRHLGKPTGEMVECESCAGRVRLRLRLCAVFGSCTEARKVGEVVCCAGCGRYEATTEEGAGEGKEEVGCG